MYFYDASNGYNYWRCHRAVFCFIMASMRWILNIKMSLCHIGTVHRFHSQLLQRVGQVLSTCWWKCHDVELLRCTINKVNTINDNECHRNLDLKLKTGFIMLCIPSSVYLVCFCICCIVILCPYWDENMRNYMFFNSSAFWDQTQDENTTVSRDLEDSLITIF